MIPSSDVTILAYLFKVSNASLSVCYVIALFSASAVSSSICCVTVYLQVSIVSLSVCCVTALFSASIFPSSLAYCLLRHYRLLFLQGDQRFIVSLLYMLYIRHCSVLGFI